MEQDRTCEIHRQLPRPELHGVVSEFIVYRENFNGLLCQRERATLDVPLLIGFREPFGIGLGRGANDHYTNFVSGLFAGPIEIESHGRCHCLQINFTPWGARRFFAVPMNELAGLMIDPSAILGNRFARLRQQLGNETEPARQIKIAEQFVIGGLLDKDHEDKTALWALRQLLASDGRMRVDALTVGLGISRKHLNHLFQTEFGLGPKCIARIVRFNAALAMAKQNAQSWADIAYTCGYSDQSHLSREFAALAGQTPASLGR